MEVKISDAECKPSAIIAFEFPSTPATIFIIVKTIFHIIDNLVILFYSSYLDSIFMPPIYTK